MIYESFEYYIEQLSWFLEDNILDEEENRIYYLSNYSTNDEDDFNLLEFDENDFHKFISDLEND